MNGPKVETVAPASGFGATSKAHCHALSNLLLLEGDPNDGSPVQFGIRAVLLLQALAAATLSLLMWLDLAGAFVLFIATVLVMFWRVPFGAARARRVFGDLLAGALMPIICVYYDPGILRPTQPGAIPMAFDPGILRSTDLGMILVAAILVQVGMLLAWQLMPRTVPALAGFFAGSLSVGMLVALGIGLYILPTTLVGLLLVVGLLGTMPFLTAIVYLRNVISARAATRRKPARPLARLMFLLGLATAIGLPVFLHEFYGREIAAYLRSLPNYSLRWL